MKFSTRALAVLMALIMIIGTLPMMAGAATVSEFSDFPAGTWSEAALTHAVNNGILQGKGDGRIAPKDYITRAEVATIINRAFGATVKADISNYTDVDESKWYYSEIQKAVNMQTVMGVSATEINPEGYITRESVFTIIARAMVLSSTDSSGLSKFVDAADVSSWSLYYTNALVNRGHINGDEKGYINPGAYITREEFAQVMYNIFKTYLPDGGSVKDATYGTTVVRGRNVTLQNLVIDGDLVVADGVGDSNININNVKVSGRILFRGGEGKVTIDKKSTAGEFVIVHDVNGTVHFNNYRSEKIFKGIVLDTKATFLTSMGGGSSGGSSDKKETYTITYDGVDYTVTEGDKIGDAEDANGNKLSTVLGAYTAPGGYENKGFKDKTSGKVVDLDSKASSNLELVPNDELIKYDVIYDANGGTVDGLSTYTDTDALDIETAYTLKTTLVLERAGYVFAGWYIDNESNIITTIPAGQTADVTVYAKWVRKSQLTFKFNSALSNDTTVAIDVVLDSMPYDADAITSIILNYEYVKNGTNTPAELTFKEVTTNSGTATGDGSVINWTGNITSAGTLFTIVFTKDKGVGYDVDFKFGDVTMKNVDEPVNDYEKADATINVGTGKAKFEITYNGKKYYAYEDEKIGDAVDLNGNKLSDVLNSYTAPDGYTNMGFKNKVTDALVNLNATASESIEIVPNNTINKYDVIYDANGGKIGGASTYTANDVLDVNTSYTLDTTIIPERDNYKFLGWYIDTASQAIVTVVPKGTQNVTVYAKWESAYVITYNGTKYYAYDGDKIGDATDANGNKLSTVLGAYTAPGGYTNMGFKNKLTNAAVNLNSAATESMEIVPNNTLNKYNVIYDANGGTVNASASYTDIGKLDVENEYVLLKSLVPKRAGYAFEGWYMDPATEAVIIKIPAGQTSNVTVYAKWVKQVVVTYDGTKYYANPGDKIGDAKDANGNKLSTVLGAYTAPDGYTNNGFKNKATDALVNVNSDAAADLEIVPNNVLNKYDVIYDANGGTIAGASTYTADDVLDVNTSYTLDASIIPERGNYKFLGWYIDTATQALVTSVPAGTQNVTVYAKWEGAYVVTYNGTKYYAYEGDKIGDAEDTNGNKLSTVLGAYTAPDGYTNFGFKNKATDALVDINANITADLEIVPNNVLNKYDVIYNANGGTIDGASTYTANDVLDVENAYTLSTAVAPVRKGYDFLGWYMDTATEDIITLIPAGQTSDVTVYAKWQAIPDSVLSFEADVDTANKKVTLKVKLNEVPHDIDQIESMTIYYTQTPKMLTYAGTTAAAYLGGSFVANEGVISWYNAADPLTRAELKADDVLFEITYTYTASANGDIVFDFGDLTEIATIVGGYGVAATDYTKKNVTINLVRQAFNVIYDANGGTIDGASSYTEADVLDSANAYTLNTTIIPQRAGYDFLGWYMDTATEDIITEIPAGQTSDVTVYAKWQAIPDSVLAFKADIDKTNKKVTLKVTLNEIPHDIDRIESMTIYYTQTPKALTYAGTTAAAYLGGAFVANEGVISWYNAADPLTRAELKADDVLFEITYTYDATVSGDIVFDFGDLTEIATIVGGYGVVAADYTKKGVTINLEKETYTITFDGNTYDVVYGNALSSNTELKDAMEAVVPSAGYKLVFEGTYEVGGTEYTEEVTLETVPSADMTIVAKEVAIPYDIKYFSNGEEIFPGKATYTVEELPYTLPVLPDTATDIFAGWYTSETFAGSSVTEIAAGTTGELKFYAKWDSELYTVTFYEGTQTNKGSYDVEAGSYVTQAQVDALLGAPSTFTMQEGYIDSDGNAHEIAPELWYQVDGEWEKFVPEDVEINRDIDVYLFTRFALFYYDTDLEIKGIKVPRIELSIAYDSNTDVIKSRLDVLTAMSGVLEGTLENIQMATGVDLFQEALDKAAKTGLVDSEGNILNPEVPVPLHKLITEDLIMKEIDRYIEQNINDEEFIAEILRNDTVVDMLLGDASIRTKVLSDTAMRDKLLTDATIKRIISKDDVIEWIITNEDFKKAFIDSDATFEYILGDLKALLDNSEYHDMLIDACVEFVVDVYFEETVSAPELTDYINEVLESDDFIADIEANPALRSAFKAEIKSLLTGLDNPETPQATKDEVYNEIRTNVVIKDAILDAITSDYSIMDVIMNEVRDDLASPSSSYKNAVIAAVRAEFADPASTLKSLIVDTVKNDIALGGTSTLRSMVVEAIKDDFDLGAASTLKPLVKDYVETQATTSGSELRESILDEAATPGSTIATYVKDYAKSNTAIKNDIKTLVKDNTDVKDQAKTWISTNIATIKGDIKDAVMEDEDALVIAIMESDPSLSQTDAEDIASDYIAGALSTTAKDEIEDKIDTFFDDDAKVLTMVEDNFDVFYAASYDNLFDELYVDDDVFDTAYSSYVSDRSKLEDAFDNYISTGTNLSDAVDAFIDGSNLDDAIEKFVDNASAADIEAAVDTYIADDENLIDAINLYIEDDANLEIVFDIFAENDANLEDAFETYIADDDNLADAIHTFVNAASFDSFYETHLGENAADPDTFNALFEAYYHNHVHEVADKAWDNPDLHDLVMQYVHDYTEEMVEDYANGTLETERPELVDTIDDLMHNQFPAAIRKMYYEPGSTIKATVDHLIEEEGTSLIKKYAKDQITDSDTVDFIKDTINDNIDIIVDGYVDGTLDPDIKVLIDDEIDTYMNKLIDDYISDNGDARETLGDLIPTYAQDAVDALKQTDAFKNTISDFVSGNGVRVNEGNIMFISILADVMAKYDYDKIMADFAPAAVTKLVDKLGVYQAEKYVNALLDTFVASMNDAADKLQADIDNGIEGTEYKFSTTVPLRVYLMKDFVEVYYNKAMPKIQSKLLGIDAIAKNPYAKRLVEKNYLTEFLDYDAAKDGVEMSGYSIKKGHYDEVDEVYGSPLIRYYDINLENKILLHDAIMWYGANYEIPIEEKLNAVSELLGTFANEANDAIVEYITTGELPEDFIGKFLGKNGAIDSAYEKAEGIYYAKEDTILNLVDKIDDFYMEKLNKDYTEVIDLAGLSIYADGEAYPIYKILLEIYEENEAFDIDTLATAIFDSDNYLGINAIENAMAKVKSKLDGFKYNPGTYPNKIVRDAYKVTVDAREIKGYTTGSHTVGAQRYFQYIK